MNFGNLLERLWTVTGYPNPSSGNREDWRFQQYKDNINATLDEIVKTNAPRIFSLQRESSFNLVPGTSLYTLDDWVARPLSLYTTDVAAHKLVMIRPRRADANGWRNPFYSFPPLGPYTFTDGMRTSAALVTGASGASTGASCTNGDSAVTLGTSGPTLPTDSTYVGRMVRFNGESNDYKIVSTAAHGITVDRPILGQCIGVGHTGVGQNLANVRWEISPPGRMRVQVLPMPSTVKTVYYRFAALPRKLVELDDTPEIHEEYHELIWKGALRLVAATKQNAENYGLWAGEFAAAMKALQNADDDEFDSDEGPKREMIADHIPPGILPGTYSRGLGVGYYQ